MVEDRTPAWAILAVVAIVILVIVAVLVFILTGGRGTVLLVAIPGFPIESIIVGLALGLLLVAFKRRSPKVGRVWLTPQIPPTTNSIKLPIEYLGIY